MNGRAPKARHRIRLVAYDIADSKRLARVAGICLDYGVRMQKSLFACDLSGKVFREMWSRLEAVIDPEEDALLAYPLCRACLRGGVAAGRAAASPCPGEGFVF